MTPRAGPSYWQLTHLRGFLPLIAAALFARTSLAMSTVALVLLALARFHSPTVAGIALFCLVFPGLLVSPVAGALLDRLGRRRLMALDFSTAAMGMLLLAGLATAGILDSVWLFVIVTFVSLTSTLSNAGSRSLFPLIVPARLWGRANAADTLCYGLAAVAGPALAGQITAVFGAPVAVACVSFGYLLAAAALLGVREPKALEQGSRSLLHDAWSGLRYVALHRTLRWLAAGVSLSNAGLGILAVAVPVLVFRLHGTAALVGGLFAVEGAAGIVAALVAGRLLNEGSERTVLQVCCLVAGGASR